VRGWLLGNPHKGGIYEGERRRRRKRRRRRWLTLMEAIAGRVLVLTDCMKVCNIFYSVKY
jgi:hypothetical protein